MDPAPPSYASTQQAAPSPPRPQQQQPNTVIQFVPQQQQITDYAIEPQLIRHALKKQLAMITVSQLKFFAAMNQRHPTLVSTGNFPKQDLSVWRDVVIDYENYMQTLDLNPNLQIQMSLEMELIWRVHMFNSQQYIDDCMRQFGAVLPHDCSNLNQKQYGTYNSNNFRAQIGINQGDIVQSTGFIGQNFNMGAALSKHMKFISNMIKTNESTKLTIQHIDAAVERYERFMECMFDINKPPTLKLIALIDIDLIWHSHQLDPSGYYSFCINNSPTQQLVPHNDNAIHNFVAQQHTEFYAYWDSRYGKGDSYKLWGVGLTQAQRPKVCTTKRKKRMLIWIIIMVVLYVICVLVFPEYASDVEIILAFFTVTVMVIAIIFGVQLR